VLGPILFSIYTKPIQNIMARHDVSYSKFADDTGLITYYCPSVPGDLQVAKERLSKCFSELRAWMLTNFLQLNSPKTEYLCIMSRTHLVRYGRPTLELGGITVGPADVVRSLGSTFDTHMSMAAQVNYLISSCNYQIHQLGTIRKYISADTCHKAVLALVTSRLDYCNVLLNVIPSYQVDRLQKVQNCAARLIARCKKDCHITPVLRTLHWLPIYQRIRFKTMTYVFKALHSLAPAYVCSLLTWYVPPRTLRSSSRGPLLKPPPPRKGIADDCFSAIAPRLWNDLPADIRTCDSLRVFKKKLKTHLFNQHFAT